MPVELNEQLDPTKTPAIIIYRSGSETVKTFSATVRTGEIVAIECRADTVEVALELEDAALKALNALNASGRLRLRNEFTSQTDFSPDLGIHRAALSVTIKT